VAKVLDRAAKRSIDLAARYGGEEFAIILPNTDLQGATRVAKDIQDALRKINIPHSGSKIADNLTLSMGVASTTPSAMISPETLITAADRALYRAKEAGRDRFCTFTP
jgi:diguanylate cyclase (GGDEF)-like protein